MGFKFYCYKAIKAESGNWTLELLAYSPRYCISVTGCFCFTLYNLMLPRSYRTSCSYSWSRRHDGDWTHPLRENIASASIGFLKHFALNINHEWYEWFQKETPFRTVFLFNTFYAFRTSLLHPVFYFGFQAGVHWMAKRLFSVSQWRNLIVSKTRVSLLQLGIWCCFFTIFAIRYEEADIVLVNVFILSLDSWILACNRCIYMC